MGGTLFAELVLRRGELLLFCLLFLLLLLYLPGGVFCGEKSRKDITALLVYGII